MSKSKQSSSKHKHEKGGDLERANKAIDELQKEKESLKQLLLQYQRSDNKSNVNNNAAYSTYTSAEASSAFHDVKKGANLYYSSHNRLQSQGDQASQSAIEKAGNQSSSSLHERIKTSQPYEEYSRKNNYQRTQGENYDQISLKTENVKEEVLRLGQTMEELYKKIEGYEKIHAMNKKMQLNKSREKKGKSYQQSSHHHRHSRHVSRKSPKKSYESTDSEEYKREVGDYSSNSSYNSSESDISKDMYSDQSSRDSSNCSQCQHHSGSKSKSYKKRYAHSTKDKYRKEEKVKRSHQHHHHGSQKDSIKQKDNDLEEEAMNLLQTIQYNPQTRLAFLQKFGNEELFLDTLKKSKNNKSLLIQIIRMMLEILNGSVGGNFSQQLYASNGNGSSNLYSSNLHKKSFSNSQVIVSPINLPKPSSTGTQFTQNINLSNQVRHQPSLDSSQQYTGENLIKMLEQKIYNPNNQYLLQQQNFLKQNSLQSSLSQNPMHIQSNLLMNNSFQQNPLTAEQLQSSQLPNNLGQSRFGLLSYYPEKPKMQFQVELREIQNREALLKMQEYETQIESLENKLKNLRGRVEEDNNRKAKEDADRLKKQQEDYQRRKIEQEQQEQLRRQKVELESQRREQEERDKERREKEEYERKLKQLKEEEERRSQEVERRKQQEEIERLRQKEREEEEEQRKKENEGDERLRQLREQDELRKRQKREEEERNRRPQFQDNDNQNKLQEYEDNYKVVPDYMKPTKNRCNYVKDVQKDYLRRSNSVTPSNSNTPKNSSNKNIITNQNWEKVLNKFTENEAQDFSEHETSPINLEEQNSAQKQKNTFARILTPTKNSSFHSSHRLGGGDTPKSNKNKNNPPNNNFSSIAKRILTEPK